VLEVGTPRSTIATRSEEGKIETIIKSRPLDAQNGRRRKKEKGKYGERGEGEILEKKRSSALRVKKA